MEFHKKFLPNKRLEEKFQKQWPRVRRPFK